VTPIPDPPTSTAPFDINYKINGFNVGYKWYDAQGLTPLFPVRFGLSYTTFTIANPQWTTDLPPTNGF
jgi:beta-glucosidase